MKSAYIFFSILFVLAEAGVSFASDGNDDKQNKKPLVSERAVKKNSEARKQLEKLKGLESRTYVDLMKSLRSKDYSEAGEAWSKIRTRHQGTLSVLLALASSQEQDVQSISLKRKSMQLLGTMRAVGAVEILIREINFLSRNPVREEFDPLFDYPAASALLQIGQPAISRLLTSRMGHDHNDHQIKLVAYIIWMHYDHQHDTPFGLLRIQRVLSKAQEEDKKQWQRLNLDRSETIRIKNLKRLVEAYQKVDILDHNDWPRTSEVKAVNP